MEKGNERNRIPNFSTSEKVCLMNISKKYQKVLEDKQTNRTSIDDKNKIWKKIENEFNSQASVICYRSSEQLKRLYANKKKELRKKFADHKKGTYITGGGPPPPDPKLDAADTILISMLNETTVSGFYSEFDSDNSGILEPSEKRRKAECDTQIYEFDPAAGSFIVYNENDSEDNVLEALNKEDKNIAEKTYRKCPPGILQKPTNQKLIVSPSRQSKETEKVQTSISTPNGSIPNGKPFNRRRPIGGIRALTSSDIAEKYNILLDKRLALVEKQYEQIIESQNYAQEEQQYKIRMLKLQEENLRLDTNEKKLKLELLQLETSYKKSLLAHDD